MRTLCLIAASILATAAWPASGIAAEDVSPAERAATARRHGLDPTSALESRATATPPDVLKMFAEGGMTAVQPHVLTAQEQRQLQAAFAALPPLHRRIVQERLRSVSFLDAMPNTALSSCVNPDEPFPLFHLTIRAGIFRETVSEWATWKDRTCFDASGSPWSVVIDAGKMDAITYVLLHEATHLVDGALHLTPHSLTKAETTGEVAPTDFTRGIWSTVTLPTPPYRDPLLQGTIYNDNGKVLPIQQAEALYTALRRTPFASLYASHASTDDLAEYVAIYHWTQVLKQPYRITVQQEGKVLFEYEPMQSDLVRRRFPQMERFYQ